MDLCLRVLKESNKNRFDSCSVGNSVLIISHITFWDCHMHISCDNLSGNSCILFQKVDVLGPLLRRHHLWFDSCLSDHFSSLHFRWSPTGGSSVCNTSSGYSCDSAWAKCSSQN